MFILERLWTHEKDFKQDTGKGWGCKSVKYIGLVPALTWPLSRNS